MQLTYTAKISLFFSMIPECV